MCHVTIHNKLLVPVNSLACFTVQDPFIGDKKLPYFKSFLDETILFGSETEDCGEPEPIYKATVEYKSTGLGAIATYTCEKGYAFGTEESHLVICTSGGNWSHSNKCKGMCFNISWQMYNFVKGENM